MDRRGFLSRSSAAGLGLWAFPQSFWEESANSKNRVLLVLEFVGGNDALNMIVPSGFDAYYRARPKIGLRNGLLPLEKGFSVPGGMKGFQRLFQEGEAAVIHGVGALGHDRSHFRSRDIWHSGRPGLLKPQEGWLGNALPQMKGFLPAAAVGDIELTLALRSKMRSVPALESIADLQLDWDPSRAHERRWLKNLAALQKGSKGLAAQVGKVASASMEQAERLRKAFSGWRAKAPFPKDRLGRGMRFVASLLEAPLDTRIVYLRHFGFDTHAGQQRTHPGLLRSFSEAVWSLRAQLKASGLWDRCCVFCWSEFGRRLAENKSLGTDHGWAAPVLLLGGGLKGGFHGEFPSLTDLADGDPKVNLDFRAVYRALLEDWLDLPKSSFKAKKILNLFEN
jgi:uncharacterized protein (DUF1501 family)